VGAVGEESNSSFTAHFLTSHLSALPHAYNPMELAQWQQNLEQAITNTLKTVSRETNHLLQQVEILPNKLPAPLEAAVNSSEASD